MFTPEEQARIDAILARKSQNDAEVPETPEKPSEVTPSAPTAPVAPELDTPVATDEQKSQNAVLAARVAERKGVPQKRSFAGEFGRNLLEAPKAFGRGLVQTHDFLFGGAKKVGAGVQAGLLNEGVSIPGTDIQLVGGQRKQAEREVREMEEELRKRNPNLPEEFFAELDKPFEINRLSDPTFLEVLGGSGEVALDVIFAGQGKVATTAAKVAIKEVGENLGEAGIKEFITTLAKKVGTREVAKTTAIGGGYGAAGSLQSGDDTLDEVVMDTLVGMGLGFALPIVAKIAGTKLTGSDNLVKANDNIFRAIKPRIIKGRNLKQVQGDMMLANQTIVDEGFVPTDLKSYTEGIAGAKDKIWAQITEQLERSGDDAVIDLKKIADEVRGMAADKTLSRVDKKAAQRLNNLADDLVSEGDVISAMEAERVKQFINSELNGTFGEFNFSKAEQNAKKLITRQIGEQLDDKLADMPGEFQSLKNKYGALRSIEDDVAKRFVVHERANPNNIYEAFGAIEGGSNIIRGLLSRNAGDIAKGIGQFALGRAAKKSNDANELVGKSFRLIQKHHQNTLSTQSAKALQDQSVQSSENSLKKNGELSKGINALVEASKRNDGGTIKLDGTAKELGDDFIVAVRSKNVDAVDEATIAKFLDENQDIVKEFGDDVNVGVFPLGDGQFSIDINLATKSKKKALELAKAGQQQSIFDEKVARETNFGSQSFPATGFDGKTPKDLSLDEIKNIRGKGDFQDFFSNVQSGGSGKPVKVKDFSLIPMSQSEETFNKLRKKHTGNFDDHIFSSIPMYEEQLAKVGDSLAKNYQGGKVLDIGGGTGSFGKAISEASGGKVKTLTIDPNTEMQKAFESSNVKGAEFRPEALLEGFDEFKAFSSKDKFDVVHEGMVFQFISPDRAKYVDEVKKFMKDDGVFMTSQKFHIDPKLQTKYEKVKNSKFKSQFFSEADINKKADEVLEGMDANLVKMNEYEDMLRDKFTYVVKYWDGGRFAGYAASDSLEAINKTLKDVKIPETEFSLKSLRK